MFFSILFVLLSLLSNPALASGPTSEIVIFFVEDSPSSRLIVTIKEDGHGPEGPASLPPGRHATGRWFYPNHHTMEVTKDELSAQLSFQITPEDDVLVFMVTTQGDQLVTTETTDPPPGLDPVYYKDTDGDMVLDRDDQCRQQRGRVENYGCPDGDRFTSSGRLRHPFPWPENLHLSVGYHGSAWANRDYWPRANQHGPYASLRYHFDWPQGKAWQPWVRVWGSWLYDFWMIEDEEVCMTGGLDFGLGGEEKVWFWLGGVYQAQGVAKWPEGVLTNLNYYGVNFSIEMNPDGLRGDWGRLTMEIGNSFVWVTNGVDTIFVPTAWWRATYYR